MPHPVDIHVGRRIRQVRWLKGMTQQQLAMEVGVKFQQMQKYETGANRVSASRLWQLSGALEVPVSFFFDSLPEEGGRRTAAGFQESDQLYERESMELVRAYYALNANLRRYFLDLIKAIPRYGRKSSVSGEAKDGGSNIRKSARAVKKTPRG